jgi:diacylglycerol kinase (ATP)
MEPPPRNLTPHMCKRMPTCSILINTLAGLHQNTATPEDLRRLVSDLGIDAEVLETGSPEELKARILALQQDGIDTIAIAGGDGTVRLAVQLLAGSATTLAILPQGTHNNFAHALGLPMQIQNALQVLAEGQPIYVDLGKVGSMYFTEAAGVGVFADILDVYGHANKNFWRGSYAIAKTFFGLRAKRLRLTIDGVVVTERAVMCTVANSYRIGAGAPVAPGASVVDGLLDVVVLGDLTRFELLRYYRAIKLNQHLQLPKTSQTQATKITIEAAFPLSLHVDDTVVGTTPAHIEIAPSMLKVLVK